MKKTMLILAAALMTLAPVSASAAVRGYVAVGRPYYGWYAPFWGPYWGYGPGYYGAYYAHPNAGEVKLDTKVKDAQVFINGSYAGTTKQNKSMYLRSGTYNLEIREAGRTQFAEKIYVVPGKTLKLHPEL
ncbi:MAG TPA: PEGA domain-containing protein [Verrucomicrobiae bacterium]|nr:PEGA domain-containing protein [Verrucomicrobiae bacterium]